MKRLSFLPLLLSLPLFGQCPADPTTVLAGRWAFLARSVAGHMVATPGSTRLTLSTTSIVGGSVTSSSYNAGNYALNPDCLGGVVYFNLAWQPIQWNFAIVNDPTFGRVLQFRGSGIPVAPPFPVPGGTLQNPIVALGWPAPTACPAGVTDPNNLLTGIYNDVRLGTITGADMAGRVEIGPLQTLFPGWTRGSLRTFLTPIPPVLPVVPPPAPPILVSNAGDPGSYQVNPGCLQGTMIINFASPRPMSYDIYSRVDLLGQVSFVVAGGNLGGPAFVGSTGLISQ